MRHYTTGETLRQKVTIHGASVGSKSLGKLDAVVTDLVGVVRLGS